MSSVDEEQLQKLEQFTNADPNQKPGQGLVKPVAGTPDRVFGAQQVAVYRDERRVRTKIAELASMAGEKWVYRIPVRGGKDISGASIKLANDLARTYGNCDVDVRMVDQGDSWIFYARFTDFETGYSLTRPFQQRKSQAAMRTDVARQQDIAFQIGVSKAIRNVIVNALQTHSDFALEEANKSLVSKIGKNIEQWRTRVLEKIAEAGFDKARVEREIGRSAPQWLAKDISRISKSILAIEEGMAGWDECFPQAPTNGNGKPAEQTTTTDDEASSE